jgi:hypothetical protein
VLRTERLGTHLLDEKIRLRVDLPKATLLVEQVSEPRLLSLYYATRF